MSKDGGPAFPQSYSGDMMPHEGIAGGLSIRDYFAAHALAGLAGGYKNLTVSVFYQYTDRGSVDVGGDGCPDWNGGKLNSYTADIRDHSVRLRLTLRI